MAARAKEKMEKKLKEVHEAVDNSDDVRLKHVLLGCEPDAIRDLCSTELRPYGSLLHHAAGIGNATIINAILDTGVDVNILQMESNVTQKQTPLHIAALAGKHPVIDALLSRGADVNAHESEGLSALHCACSGNDVRSVELLLKAGAVINEPDTRGQHPIQRSILRSSNDITKLMIERGADVNVVDEEGKSMLHYAVEWANEELVEIFLNTGISANLQDKLGCSPLHLAEDETIKQLLIQHGGDITLRDNRGRPVVGVRLDTDREEYKRINALLESRLKPPETIDPSAGRMADIQQKINQLVLPSGEDYRSARTGMMDELLNKTKPDK